MTTRAEIREWFKRGVAEGATHMIVACDSFDHDDYPVYVKPGEDARAKAREIGGQSMQSVMEVYCLGLAMEPQLVENRAFHYDAVPAIAAPAGVVVAKPAAPAVVATPAVAPPAAAREATPPDDEDVVPPERWGHDHWSVLAFVESRVVDHGGRPDREHMRCDVRRHPLLANSANRVLPSVAHPTRLAGGEVRAGHDDWDCVDDLAAAGLVAIGGTGLHPRWSLTDAGWEVAGALRKHLGRGAKVVAFAPPTWVRPAR